MFSVCNGLKLFYRHRHLTAPGVNEELFLVLFLAAEMESLEILFCRLSANLHFRLIDDVLQLLYSFVATIFDALSSHLII